MNLPLPHPIARALALAGLALLAGCSSITDLAPTKRIDYKSASTSPSLELPPDLTTPRYDERYNVNSASGLAAQGAVRGTSRGDLLPTNPEAKIVRSGNERWLVVRATPEQAWNVVRSFWQENGFTIAVQQPTTGIIETDWAENRAEVPQESLRKALGPIGDALFTTYKQDKFRTRIERGIEPGTVEIFISHRGSEQVPTAKSDGATPTGFAWAAMPPNPTLEAEFLTKMMVKFGTEEPVARTAVAQAGASPERARVEKNTDGSYQLYVDDQFDRAWRRVGLALDRIGFTVVDRDRSRGVYFVRYGDPDALGKKKEGILDKLAFWKTNDKDKPEQYQIVVAETAQTSTVSVQDPGGAPDRTSNSEKILSLLKDQLK